MPGRNEGYFGLFHILANKFDKAKPGGKIESKRV